VILPLPPPDNITDVISITPPLPNRITKSTWAPYRIVRGSRALGDEPLKLPDNTIIDLNTNNSAPVFTSNNSPPLYAFTPNNALPLYAPAGTPIYFEILFSPSGQVITRNLTSDKIHLWVRVPNTDFPNDPFRGDPTLVTIFVRTGFVGAYSPDPAASAGGNPYTFVK
jgi:hypothetical protein